VSVGGSRSCTASPDRNALPDAGGWWDKACVV
jgi:hypothetical protein